MVHRETSRARVRRTGTAPKGALPQLKRRGPIMAGPRTSRLARGYGRDHENVREATAARWSCARC